MTFQPGALVAVMGGASGDQIRRICRIVCVLGTQATVCSDDEIEGDAAIEHDFETLEPWEGVIDVKNLRPISEGK